MKLRYSLSHILLVVTIVALICGWVIDHKRMVDEVKADHEIAGGIAADVLKASLDFIPRQVYLVKELQTDKTGHLASLFLATIDSRKENYCLMLKFHLDRLNEAFPLNAKLYDAISDSIKKLKEQGDEIPTP